MNASALCGAAGCFGSDTAAAVEQAILDGVNVINFSISGGANPYSDPVELAFLDAYAAGVSVSASAGNSGPGAATAHSARQQGNVLTARSEVAAAAIGCITSCPATSTRVGSG